ncbi:uncharacterized protein A1O9_09977 [Exophiala aquamarina CBS 119918]|uniref:Metallo-beta-lactamase domain-containing protein n=1 Tax=Exophiala aquamarina CBS 119918 TaxID=1182545 RepID=A0A072P3A3_9EURO|nr:uncharacterized protein A1O9_09977 [Exophiala aquamarina CBS 119918]KEF54182.1 hypothetical protein A1O9_09977 [Exophiala aquamarina CBS 119918]
MATDQISPSFEDRTDFQNADRGFVGKLSPCIIRDKDGRVVWNNDQYDFLQAECPPTANAKLWRQGQLCARQGLFKVTEGIYQVRGLDISNITFVEGRTGVLVVDPLVSIECAAAALALYRKHRGSVEVKGVIYSHSHMDHFGGAAGVLPQNKNLKIPIYAPNGFMEEVLSENIFAGPAMRRRAEYMFGSHLLKKPDGQLGTGLGLGCSSGQSAIVAPTVLVTQTGEEHTVDGIRIVFQMVPGTEAPAEINFYFPDHRALCIAECATHVMHNIITLRGAQVRDAKAWSKYLDETISVFGTADVLFAGHHWPTWGRKEICQLLSEQRDFYAYLHDQTVRMMNTGLSGIQIAEQIRLPTSLQKAWHIQGFYGSVSHNVKAVYQRYLGWFDGNPAHLWQHPPEEEGKRYLKCFGGVDGLVQRAREFEDDNDLRFAATLLDHALYAAPASPVVKSALSRVFEKLGFGAENATWRNFYLTKAQDLRQTSRDQGGQGGMTDIPAVNPALSVDQWFDCLSINLDGPRCEETKMVLDFYVPDEHRRWRVNLSNGALTNRSLPEESHFEGHSDLSVSLSKRDLYDVLRGRLDSISHKSSELQPLHKLLGLLSISVTQAVVSSRL